MYVNSKMYWFFRDMLFHSLCLRDSCMLTCVALVHLFSLLINIMVYGYANTITLFS